MCGYVECSKTGNRHVEFIRSIFIDTSEKRNSEKEKVFSSTLDELLSYILEED